MSFEGVERQGEKGPSFLQLSRTYILESYHMKISSTIMNCRDCAKSNTSHH